MSVIEWIMAIFIGLAVLAFAWNFLQFLWEFISSVGKVVKGEKPSGEHSDPRWTGRL